jgi:hypothetical protein
LNSRADLGLRHQLEWAALWPPFSVQPGSFAAPHSPEPKRTKDHVMDTHHTTGTCRCSSTEIEVSQPPIMTAACHCTGCQKMSSSAFSLTATFAASAFRVLRGTPVKGGMPGTEIDHFFCPDCKTWMFTRLDRIEGAAGFVNVRPTMFPMSEWSTPFIETMTDEKLAWAATPARHSFARFPSMEQFAALFQDFAAQS